VLDLFEVTSVSAALAIKRLGGRADDMSGIRDALVDLWGRAEAARSLLFDVDAVWTGVERDARQGDLCETARLLAPDAIAIAMRLSEPVSQYVEFASKVVKPQGQGAG
jgi:alkylation response protein AidB-like acyl-CoA dehydrogenase